MKQIEIKTLSNNLITAQIYGTKKDSVLIISSATGVKQNFYRRFADFVSGLGITVITFDYSGIGFSLKVPIQQIKSSASDWGKNDLEAVIRYTKKKYPDAKITLLGHSIGGQIIGLAKSSAEVQKVILIAAQSGYWKLWKGFDRVLMWTNWHVLFPALINLFGYMPSKRISGMENLPKFVAKQWSSWGRKPNYLFDEVSEQDLFFNDITTKVVAISIENDFYAPKAAVDFFTERYKNAVITKLHLSPKDFNTKDIGHFGIFRGKFESSLWKLLYNEIDK
ncbi:alpha/beta hydrolase family protein [Flavobacterium sedimenticola]|uniref:Alpha/beta fold hydrolase n=1 Tax=Flavobacterium sedimenticola TaxID=3043286 RepID=A0ABT6XSD2_9FLAO|nr:alpha/beta fold hydrolase [Flavobacterium sedimenticola]MDI9257887.1 alpha/beta fold hydrolase [Flavobacterium sedimenticola]